MADVRKLDHFYYSQNALNIFYRCPLKFKLKYIDNINWKNDILTRESYYENMEKGLNFHLICERYFSNIPTGIEKNNEEFRELHKWFNNIKELIPILNENIYLPEYEVRIIKDFIKIQAKYDLIIIKPEGKIQIWDWKTENRKLDYKEMANRFQTIVYMYIIGERGKKLFNKDIKSEDIEMIFWQPQYKEEKIVINYSEDKHKKYETKIKNTINRISNYDFNLDFNKNLYKNHCKYCEFNYLCNY